MANLTATLATYLGPQGPPADFGQDGYEVVRIPLDGAGDGIILTPPATLSVKTALRVVGCASDIPIGGKVLNGVNTITLKFPVYANLTFLDVLIFGRGR